MNTVKCKAFLQYHWENSKINKKLNKYFTDMTEEDKEMVKESENDVVKFLCNNL